MRNGLLMMFALCTVGLGPTAADSQTVVAFEVGASQVGPPSGLDAEYARFGIAGIRASRYGLGGSGISGSIMFGRALGDTTGGDFVSGLLAGSLRDQWGTRWVGGLDLEAVGFQVRAPFPYTAVAVEGGPSVSFTAGPVTTTARGVFGIGSSRVEVWRHLGGARRTFQDDLWRAGTEAELALGTAPLRIGLTAGVHDTPGGTYSSGGARVILAGTWGAVEARGDLWSTPLQSELTGGLTFVLPLSGWSVRGFFGKSEPDPLTLAEPGSGSAGLLLSLDLFRSEPALANGPLPYMVVSDMGDTARVRIRLNAPAGARSVAVLGDFTLWDALPMQRDGDGWVAEVEVPYGTHHYGFLVDDEWHVPDDVQDVVPDEWGRVNAILVIEGGT